MHFYGSLKTLFLNRESWQCEIYCDPMRSLVFVYEQYRASCRNSAIFVKRLSLQQIRFSWSEYFSQVFFRRFIIMTIV